MKNYVHPSGVNPKGFWLTRENNHVVQAVLAEETDFSVSVNNWTTGGYYTNPRTVVAAMHPVPDEVIDEVIRDAGFTTNARKLWDLGARFRLDGFTLRQGRVYWPSEETDLQLVMPESIITVTAMRQAILERYGVEPAGEIFQRASRIAFHNAGQEPFALTPDVKDA